LFESNLNIIESFNALEDRQLFLPAEFTITNSTIVPELCEFVESLLVDLAVKAVSL
jgi:hypothetical protein